MEAPAFWSTLRSAEAPPGLHSAPRLDIRQYASLQIDLERDAQHAAEILAWYQLSRADKDALDAKYAGIFAQYPSTWTEYEEARRVYFEWLHRVRQGR